MHIPVCVVCQFYFTIPLTKNDLILPVINNKNFKSPEMTISKTKKIPTYPPVPPQTLLHLFMVWVSYCWGYWRYVLSPKIPSSQAAAAAAAAASAAWFHISLSARGPAGRSQRSCEPKKTPKVQRMATENCE